MGPRPTALGRCVAEPASQLEGIAKAKAEGKYRGGIPTARAKAEQVFALVDAGKTRAEAADELGIQHPKRLPHLADSQRRRESASCIADQADGWIFPIRMTIGRVTSETNPASAESVRYTPAIAKAGLQCRDPIWKSPARARHPEIRRGTGRADIQIFVEEFGDSLRQLIDSDEEYGLELQSLDVLDIEHADIVFLAYGLAVRTSHDAYVVRHQSFVQSLHHHAGIGLMTPDKVHYGQADEVYAARQKTLDRAFQSNPERFVRKPPEPPLKPIAAWINPRTQRLKIQA